MTGRERAPVRREVGSGRSVRAVAVVTATVAVVALVLGFRPAPASEPVERDATPLVPVFSARRLPHDLADEIGAMQLPLRAGELLDGRDACLVVEDGDQVLLDRRGGASLVPASSQKLLVGAAALSVLGPEHRFETTVAATAGTEDGTVERLWLVGGADPVLMVSDYGRHLDRSAYRGGHPRTLLGDLADAVVAAGIRRVEGPILGDASRHQGRPTVPTWKESYITDRDISFLSALTVNGGWQRWQPGRVTAPDPAVEAASELTRLLEERGVEVAGEPARGVAPEGAGIVASVESPPLRDVVAAMVSSSDNLIAEMLVREVGLARSGVGDTPAGTDAVRAELDELGVPVEGVVLRDGSGLDRGNQATCRALLDAVELRGRDGLGALDTGLAVAGRSGTLYRRLEGTALEGRLRAKTGSLDGVVGLVGVLEGGDGPGADSGTLEFAMLVNGSFAFSEGARLQDRLAVLLHRYPFTFEDADLLAPPAARPAGAAPAERARERIADGFR